MLGFDKLFAKELMVHILFVVDGAFGTGKKQLVDYIRSQSERRKNCFLLGKYTFAEHKYVISEKISKDLTIVTEDEFEGFVAQSDASPSEADRFYDYEYTNQRYGFLKRDLDKALLEHTNVFVIVRDKRTIEQLVGDYPDVWVVPVYIYTAQDQLTEGLRNNGIPDDQISFHVKRQQRAWQDFLEDPRFYRLVTHWPEKQKFNQTIDALIQDYTKVPEQELWISHRARFRLIEPLIGHKARIIEQLKKFPYNRNVFLMMKYRTANAHLAKKIEAVLKEAGFNCVRGDDKDWKKITGDSYNPTAIVYCCRYGIALFDQCVSDAERRKNEYSPTVAYELGMMHLQEKECLLLRHTSLSLQMPFNITAKLREEYTSDEELQMKVADWVKTLHHE